MHSYNDDKTSHITCAHFTTPEAEVGFKAACRYVGGVIRLDQLTYF